MRRNWVSELNVFMYTLLGTLLATPEQWNAVRYIAGFTKLIISVRTLLERWRFYFTFVIEVTVHSGVVQV